jgi:hypothetical protein
MCRHRRSQILELCPAQPARAEPERTEKMTMKRFLIEREIPGASEMTMEDLAGISKTSNGVVETLGVPYNWIGSYVAGDKVYCFHEAESADVVREHARRGNFPANLVVEIANEFGPRTAELVTR